MATLFVLVFPFQFIFLQFKSGYYIAHQINSISLRLAFLLMGFRVNVDGKEHLSKDENYVFVANHFSMMDIPMMFFVVPKFGVFVGKSSLENLPLFGYMYKKLYIGVDRRNADSRGLVYKMGIEALGKDKNLIIFPEGTISMKAPKMLPLKDGAFSIAQQSGKKIVPVTIFNNWKILPDGKPITIKNFSFAAKISAPIEITGDSLEDIKQAKLEVIKVFEREIRVSLQ